MSILDPDLGRAGFDAFARGQHLVGHELAEFRIRGLDLLRFVPSGNSSYTLNVSAD